MPELFRFYGFLFYFYSREHEPIHVHVEGAGGLAIFDYVESRDAFELRDFKNIKSGDLAKIKSVIADNKDIIVKRWNNYFYGENC